jgi:hypothetical protein
MRRGLFYSVLLVLCFVIAAEAGVAVHGTAVQVDRGSGRVKLVETGTMKVVTVVANPSAWPAGVAKGSEIRVWGRFRRGKPLLFQADKISVLPSAGRGNDPTGVRSRLFRDRGK